MPLVLEGVMSSRSRNLMADLTLLRKEGLTTDTRVVVVDNKKGSAAPILAHSLVLAAASPVLASILASSGDTSEGFTIILPGMEWERVEKEMDRMYKGNLHLDLLTHLGLLVDVKEEVLERKERKVSENLPADSPPVRKMPERTKKVVNYSPESDIDEFDMSDNFHPSEDLDGREDLDYEGVVLESIAKDDMKEDEDKDVKDFTEDIPDEGENESKKLACPHQEECKWKYGPFSSESGLKRHLNRIHNIGQGGRSAAVDGQWKPNLKGGKLTCPHCKKKYVNKERLNSHIQRDHIRSTCEHCGKVFNSGNYLATHIERKHSSKQFHCDQCEYSTSMKRDLKYHMESKHENTTHVCEECGKSYSHKNILAMHIKEKHGNMQSLFQICDQCDYTCTGYYGQMQMHKDIAHCSTKFICTFCTFVTTSSYEMDVHKENNHKHENVQLSPQKMNDIKRKEREALQDHICHVCNVKMNSRQGLSAHIKREHEGVKFHCPEDGCDVSKPTKTQIKKHVDVVHKGIRHKCETCGKLMTSEGNLKNHMIKKHKVEMFACNKCSVRCWSSERMKNHMLIHQ